MHRINSDLVKLGNNIRAERNRLHYSQEKLAEIANIQMQHLSKIENGEIDIRFTTLLAIMNGLNISFEHLYK